MTACSLNSDLEVMKFKNQLATHHMRFFFFLHDDDMCLPIDTFQFEDFAKQLTEPSVIVMDNASYHSRSVSLPKLSHLKRDIHKFMERHGIAYSLSNTKVELISLIEARKEVRFSFSVAQPSDCLLCQAWVVD